MQRFLFWLRGYVLVIVKKDHIERFINICAAQNKKLYRLKAENGSFAFCIAKKDYMGMLPVFRKTRCYPKLLKKKGAVFLGRRITRHAGLIPGFLTFLLLIAVLSMFLWDIRFEGNSKHTEEQLIRFVNQSGIGFGSRCEDIDCPALEAAIREQFPDIAWVSCELKGSRMTIRVKESEFESQATFEEQEPSHIISDCNGIVTDIIARSGVPLVKAGDVVRKGDILISGVIATKNEYDELINTKAVCAEGTVHIKTDLLFRKEQDMNYTELVPSGKKRFGIQLGLFHQKIFLYMPSIPYDKYDIITEAKTWKLSDNLYLPVSHAIVTCNELQEYQARYSKAQLSTLCYAEYLAWLEQLCVSGYSLLEENAVIRQNGDFCVMESTVTVSGPLWKRAEIKPEELLFIAPTEGESVE